jgi:hypothetical protein
MQFNMDAVHTSGKRKNLMEDRPSDTAPRSRPEDSLCRAEVHMQDFTKATVVESVLSRLQKV